MKIKGFSKKIINKPIEGKTLTALDIGTENIKALIAKNNNGTLEIRGVGKQHQRLSDMGNGAISDISGVVRNCEEALKVAEDMAGVNARQVVVGLAGELVKGKTTTVTYKRPNPKQNITMLELEHIMQKIQDRAMARAKAELSWELGNDDVEVRLVNSAVVSIEIDGYKITNPLGFSGGDVVISLFTAFAPLIHIAALEKVAEELDLDLVAVAAEPFAVARGVTSVDEDTNFSAILIDVGGGTTDIAVVNEGGVEGAEMFNIGGRSFTHAIGSDLGMEFNIAEEYKIHASDGTLKSHQSEVEKSIERTLEIWLGGVELA
jgi:cell division protein FtsA